MINKNTINFGLLLGGILVVGFLLNVVIEPGWIGMMGIMLVTYVIGIILLVRFVKSERRLNNGVISFKEAFIKSFASLVIASLLSTGIGFLYITLIDPGYPERLTLQTMESTASFMEGNVPDEQVAETLKEIETDMTEGFTLAGQLKTFAKGLIFYAVLALIIAAVLKRKLEPTDETILDA